jgi:nitroreductase
MNNIISAIYERRAVRKYKEQPLTKELVDQLIDAAKMAPSAMNRQPWKFYVLTNKTIIHSLAKEIMHHAIKEIRHITITDAIKATLGFFHFSTIKDYLTGDDHVFYGAPAVIFITVPKADEWGAIDVGMCAQNIMLAAKAMGLDTCPIGFAKYVSQARDYHLLNIPDKEEVQLAVIVGYGYEQPKPHERIEDNVVYI